MAAIEGFTEYYNEVLAAAQVGDLVLVQGFPKPAEGDESDVESEAESEGPQEGEEDGVEGAEEDGVVGAGSDGEQGVDNAVDNAQQSTNMSQPQPFIEQAIDAALAESVESDVENEVDSGDEVDEADDSEQEREGEVDEDDEEEDDGSEDGNAVATPPSPTLYIIQDVTKNENGNITDITLRKLTYCLKPADASPQTFHLYGRKVKVNSATAKSPTTSSNQDQIHANEDPTSIKDIIDLSTSTYDVHLKPTGTDLLRILFHNRCPAQCHNGWLSTQEEMHLLVSETIRLLSPYSPVCPVCLGKRLMRNLQTLRENYEDTYQPDIAAIVDFYFELNPRRKALGYGFKQFDEREWGMQFDDMLSDSSDDEGGHWEQWDEANDPNSNPNFQGAGEGNIAALPRKSFGEVQETFGEMEEVRCLVCTEAFAEETVVVVLPCGHFFDVMCAEIWLGRSNSCPQCREKIPAVERESGGGDGEGEEKGESAGDEGKESKGSSSAESEVVEMDGEDVVMSDVEAENGVGA